MSQQFRPFRRARRNSDSDRRRPKHRSSKPPARSAGRFTTLALLTSAAALLVGCNSFSCEELRACTGEGAAGAGGQAAVAEDFGLGGAQAKSDAPRGCPAGYRRDDERCVDIDECAEGIHACSTEPAVSCTNTRGGFACGPCPAGYTGSGDRPDGCLFTAPTVTGTSPGQGARGVAVDAPIVVTFSEAMDPATTEAAFSSTHAALASPTFTWNADDTQLTVTPNALYPIAEVTSASEPAEAVTYVIADSAEDVEGERLFEALGSSFSAPKRVTETIALEVETSGSVTAQGSAYSGSRGRTAANGDTKSRALLAYDLSAVPPLAHVESATIASSYQGTICTTGVPASGGPGWPGSAELTWSRVSYPARDLPTATNLELSNIYQTVALDILARKATPSDVTSHGQASVALGVTNGVRRFLADRSEPGEHLLYRVSSSAHGGCGGVAVSGALTLVYLSE